MKDSVFAELVREAYGAVDRAGGWEDFLRKYLAAIGADISLVGVELLGSGSSRVNVSIGLGPKAQTDFEEYYSRLNPYSSRVVQVHPGEMLNLQELVPDVLVKRTEFYNDFLLPHGLCMGGVAMPIRRTPSGTSMFAVHTSAEKGVAALAASMALQRRMAFHICRALELEERLMAVRRNNEDLLSAIDLNPTAIVLCDSHHMIRQMNPAAEAVFKQSDGLQCRHRKIGITSCTSARIALRGALHVLGEQFRDADERRMPFVHVPRPSGKASYQLMVYPIPPSNHILLEQSHRSIVFIHDPSTEAVGTIALLRRIYELTPKEAQVCFELVSGKSTGDIAEKLQITRETLKSHIGRVLSKTKTQRQAQLVGEVVRGLARLRLNGCVSLHHSRAR